MYWQHYQPKPTFVLGHHIICVIYAILHDYSTRGQALSSFTQLAENKNYVRYLSPFCLFL